MGLSFPKIKLPQLKTAGRPAAARFALPFLGRKREELALGLDIGSHAVKICEMAATGNGYRLKSLGSALLPPDSLEDGALVAPEEVAKVIAALIANLKTKTKKVALSVSGYSVIVKKINLEVMSAEELDKHIHEEAEQYIPFDIDDVYLDCQDLHTNTEEEARTDVMLVAAKKEVVDGYLEMLQSIGLKPVVVDVDAFALENAFETGFGQDENVALVDIGASKMNLNLLAGGSSALARDVVLGGRQLTEQIAKALNLSFDEAEELKLGRTAAPDPETEETIARLVRETCTQCSAEIKRALDFYQTNHPDDPIQRLVISGGGAKLAGLADFLGRETGLQAEIFNPFARAEVDESVINPAYLKAVAPEMVLAAGLATRPVEF